MWAAFLGTGPLAAVGSTGSINFLILGFCLGICAGFAIPVSQSYGAKDYKDLKRYVGNILWLAAAFTLVITLATVVLCRPILQWMDTPADIIDDAYNYIVVIFLGIPTIVLYNVLASLLRALGDSRTPVIFLVVASLLNIGLDLFLILVIPMGVAGAAWATVISQGISGLACLVFIWKKFPLLHISREGPGLSQRLRPAAAGDGHSHGAAKLHHRHWQHSAPDLCQWAGVRGGGLCHRGKQAVPAFRLRL